MKNTRIRLQVLPAIVVPVQPLRQPLLALPTGTRLLVRRGTTHQECLQGFRLPLPLQTYYLWYVPIVNAF